jgi:hypothetical protein
VAGTRVRVTDILDMLASGVGEAEILADFNDISREDIRACLAYAARTTLQRPAKASQDKRSYRFTARRMSIQKVQGGYVPTLSSAGSGPPKGGSAAKPPKE